MAKQTNDTLTRTLTKADVVNMLRGTSPSGEAMQKAIDMGIGEYYGGMDDHFEWVTTWREAWERYTIKELYDLYCDIEIDNQREDVDKLYSVYLAYYDTGVDPGIEGVFSTQDKAEQFARKHGGLSVAEYIMNEKEDGV
ncbi:MAG: hypothetical protein IJ111_09000 [Eggerthellaceae bacterium]|nr:hypothetical protein [Eggerthellaceae bacterium]